MSTLRLATASNVRAFQILTDALDASDGKWSQWIESETLDDEVGRFRVWAGNLGALQKGHSSLDYRLRGSPVLFSSALRLLHELEQNLNETYAIVSEARLPYEAQKPTEGSDNDSDKGSSSEEEEDDSDSDEPRSELRMRYEEIVDIIDNLYKLSVRIRTPTVRSRSLKASAYTPIDPETGVDILGVYAELDRKHVQELLSKLRGPRSAHEDGDSGYLTERLSSSITLRRRHFKYWKRHRDKLGASTSAEDAPDAGKLTSNEAAHLIRDDTFEAPSPIPVINSPKTTPSQKTGKTLLSGTEATHHHQSLDDIVDTKSTTSYAVTVRDLDGKGIDLPPPPKAASSDKDFECPYCWIVCPARYGKGRAWKTHLLQDLQPYICTYQDCESSEQLFRSRREWAEHEATHRKLWRCPEHIAALYNSQSGLENHLRREHIGSFPDEKIAIMAKIGEVTAVDSRDQCPICFVSTDTEGLGDLQSHVANHLERIATFALPHGREDDEDGASSVASRGSSNSQSLPESTSTDSSDEIAALNGDLESEQSLEFEVSEEVRLVQKLKKEGMPWKVIHARVLEVFGKEYTIPELQARRKLLRDQEERLLLQLRDEEDMPWEDVVARFQDAFGMQYQIPELQRRIERIKEWPFLEVGTSRGPLSTEMLQQLPDESQNRLAMFSNQVDDLPDSDDEQAGDQQLDEDILPEHKEHLEEQEAFRQHILSLPGAQSVRFYRRYGSWTGLITFADDLVGEQAIALFDAQRFPNIVFQSKKNKSKWKFTRTGTSNNDNSIKRQPTADTQTTEEADILASGSETYDEEDEEESKQAIISTAEIPTLRSLYQSRRLLQRDQSFAPNDTYNQIISFCHYDLTRLRVDAIVNNATANFKVDPDPDSLHHAIYKAGGSGLRKEARAKARVKVGQVELTHGHDLPSSWVIHAAAPGYTGRKGVGQFNVLSACYRSAMRMAANHEFKTIAFPCLGTGGCMFPSRVAARIALQEIREYLDAHPEHRPERIIFCVRAAVDEKAYTDFLPVFFPPTHGDLDRARTSDWSATRAALAAQVLDARTQLQNALTAISDTYDFGTQSTVCAHDMHRINSTLASIRNYLLGSGELKQSLSDLNLLCSVILTACADIMEMAERAQKQGLTREAQFIWTEANANIRAKHGFDLTSVFDYSWIFANSLADALLLDMSEPDAMGRARHILETYGAQQKGHDVEDIRDPIDKAPEVHDSERPAAKIRGLVQVHQIPSVARLYILGHLEAKTTMAKPSTQFNHTVCLLREDITRLEVDIVVNSTDASFSGMGTLDRSIFKKGGEQLRSQVKAFGRCEEGDVKATPGYLLPAKHILHVVPPGQFRKDTKNVLRNIYRAILHDAVLMKATSIAIPSIGTGTLNYPRRDCVSLAIEEVKRFLESAEPGNGLDKIIFVVLPSNDEFIYKSLLPVYFPPTKGNTSPTMLAKQPTKTEESSSPPLPAPANSSPSGSEEKTPRGVRFGKQPVKSRPYNDQEAGALMDFDLHVDVCRICDNGLYERTHKLCKPGYLLAQTVLRRMEMSEDANVYSKADTKNQREQLEIPMEQLPSSMLLLSTIAKGAENTLGGTFIEVDEPDTTQPNDQVQEDDNVAQSPVAEDADIVEQATEQPAVVRVEVRVSSPDWVYSWIRVFKSKIEVYFGDYDPDPYGGSTGDPPDLSIDLTDTVAELTRNDPWTLSLLATPRRRELGIEWQFRNSEAADSIALFGLLKRAINRSRQGQGKSLLAEIGGATSSESIIPPVAQPENTGEALDTLSGSERDQLIRKYYRLRKTGWYDATGMQEIIDTVSQIIQTTDPDDRMAEEDLLKQLRQRQSEITAYDIQNQVDNKRHSGEDTDPQYVAHADTTSIPGDGPKDPSLETQILAYLDDDFKNRPGSYIGQKLEEIASALGLGPRFISWSLERLAAEGKVHKTIDDDTWVISQPGTELSSSERENKPAKLGFAETKALANRILIKMLVAQHPPSIPDLTFTLQTSTSTFWSAIRYLVAMKFIGSVSEGQRWTLTTAGRLRARGLQKISAEAGQEASRDTESVTSDEDPSNNLSGRALSYLRSLPGMSENVWDFATTLDTSVAELQPVLEQLGSEGLVENTEDRFIWKATPSSDCVPGNPRSMSTDVAPHSPILAESASATVKDTKASDDTSTPHTQPTDSGSSIMDAAIASGQIQISEFFNYDNRRWNHATSHRTQINSSFVDERVLAQAAFRPDEQAGVYFVERKVQPEEVEEWIRQTRELQEEDTKIEREGHGKHTSSVSQSHPGGSTRAEPTLPTATDPQVDTPASKQEEQDHPTKPPEDPAATPPTASSKASSWRDGRGAKERRQTKSSRVLTDEIEEDMESGTASSLRQSKIARERKYKKASRAHTDDIDSELESYDGQEEDYV